MTDSYPAVAIQTNINMVDPTQSEEDVRKVERTNLNRAVELIDWVGRENHRWSGGPILMCLPESFLHGFPRAAGAQLNDILKMAIKIPGDETDILAKKAVEHESYICAQSYENDEEWPGGYFNTAFIIDPSGKIILRSRKINVHGIEAGVGPNDILDQYVKRYGPIEKSIFPVVDTPIGKLAALVCADGLFTTEIARCLALNGAEVLLYPISTFGQPRDNYHLVCKAHAYFNACYIVSANVGMNFSRERPQAPAGYSPIVDYSGHIMNFADSTGETTVSAVLNIQSLRAHRMRWAFMLAPATALYRPFYERTYYPPNLMAEKKPQRIGDDSGAMRDVVRNMIANGWLTPPRPSQSKE